VGVFNKFFRAGIGEAGIVEARIVEAGIVEGRIVMARIVKGNFVRLVVACNVRIGWRFLQFPQFDRLRRRVEPRRRFCRARIAHDRQDCALFERLQMQLSPQSRGCLLHRAACQEFPHSRREPKPNH
jgi:hypothetical protein